MRNIYIEFEGYKWDRYDFPNTSGVYAIYSTYSTEDGRNVGKLKYIGVSNDLKRRIMEHSSSDYPSEDKYCYSFCELDEYDANIAESALIRKCRPVDNIEYKDNYPYEDATLYISGDHKGIPTKIIMIKSE